MIPVFANARIMARRPRVFAPGLLYHVIVRGNQRRKTFRSDVDYKAYLERLEKYRAQCQVRIYAYCLMPNHVHLLVENGNTPLRRTLRHRPCDCRRTGAPQAHGWMVRDGRAGGRGPREAPNGRSISDEAAAAAASTLASDDLAVHRS